MEAEATLLPPAASPLERAFSAAGAAAVDVPIDVGALWDPQTCPIELLPWLAWSLSIDRWDAEWSNDDKRAAVAGAIAAQRIKGTRLAVEQLLADFDPLIELVEWFEASPALAPHTFEIRLPVIDGTGTVGGARVSATVAREIVREVSRAKPLRAHFELLQSLPNGASIELVLGAQATHYRRVDATLADASADQPWADLIQDENGEPLQEDDGTFIDGSAA